MSKKAQAVEIARSNPSASRQQLIEMFVNEINMSAATASSYASTVRNELIAEAPLHTNPVVVKNETDAEIMERLDERFDTIDMLANASCLGKIRSLIISGPAGLGKSYTVEKAVEAYDPDGMRSIIAKGFVKATGLYLLLHEYRHEGNVIVLDDADSIFRDEDALNILKGALDTSRQRIISWRSETKMTDADGEPIDRTFEFKGTVIFLTNVDFDEQIAKGSRMSPHFEALISRSHYVECDMHSTRDYVIRIQQVCDRGMLVDQKGLSRAQSTNVVDFIKEHKDRLRELTLRMALKLADLYKMDAGRFEQLARVACFKRS